MGCRCKVNINFFEKFGYRYQIQSCHIVRFSKKKTHRGTYTNTCLQKHRRPSLKTHRQPSRERVWLERSPGTGTSPCLQYTIRLEIEGEDHPPWSSPFRERDKCVARLLRPARKMINGDGRVFGTPGDTVFRFGRTTKGASPRRMSTSTGKMRAVVFCVCSCTHTHAIAGVEYTCVRRVNKKYILSL